jgi:hypothetical protein
MTADTADQLPAARVLTAAEFYRQARAPHIHQRV